MGHLYPNIGILKFFLCVLLMIILTMLTSCRHVSEMSHLEEEHPEAFKYLKSGGFSVQIGEGNPFGKVPVHQAREETVNKDTDSGPHQRI